MSFLKKVAGVFVEMDEKPSKPTPKGTIPLSSSSIETYPGRYINNNPALDHNPDFLVFRDQFTKILSDENARNHPGNDYYEFVAMKNAMSAISQEAVKYQAAFAGWSIGGLTKKTLVDTGNTYLGLVDKEIKEFEEAYSLQYATQVTKNEQLIEQKKTKILEYTNLITSLNQEISTLQSENQQNTVSLQSKHAAFMAAGQDQRQEILDELNNINQYIN